MYAAFFSGCQRLHGTVRISEVHTYTAFGTRLHSTFELPELVPAPPSPRSGWTLDVRENSAPPAPGHVLGTDTVYGSITVRLSSTPDAFRLEFDDTGVFDVGRSRKTITWYPGQRRDGAAVRADLLGRVMAVAAHADGAVALHASAVSVDGSAIAFLGPKHAGKSTLAMALVRRGARLLTDDTLVVRFGADGLAWASPGVQRIRLWDDSARALGADMRTSLGAKPVTAALPPHQVELVDVPLSACYVIRPVAGAPNAVVGREPLSSRQAALACVSFSKLGSLVGREESAIVLDRAMLVSRAAAFYLATVHRDLARLDPLADEVLGWNRSVVASTPGER
jgi:hypothetical protein